MGVINCDKVRSEPINGWSNYHIQKAKHRFGQVKDC